ncbi:hypothetical protein C8Q75DRAFT_783712 [Abortiporus biennis]|nr:hypothetical protein C8Q75DRAFT_783712 [Abortiporus biennis]
MSDESQFDSNSIWAEHRETLLLELQQRTLRQQPSEPTHTFSSPSFPIFFYGTLALPHVLQKVLNLTETPTLVDGYVRGWELKMWGPYPALIKVEAVDTERVTSGKVWMVPGGEEGESILRRLQRYETENYTRANETVYFADNREPSLGCLFRWNGYPNDLKEGTFDASRFPSGLYNKSDSLLIES